MEECLVLLRIDSQGPVWKHTQLMAVNMDCGLLLADDQAYQ